jgi:hypothetical protein
MSNDLFEVLSPWAEADPIAARGISPRLSDLAGKKIGLYRNDKRTALPMSEYIQAKLKEKYPTAEFSSFANLLPNQIITLTPHKKAFEDWLKGVDAVVAMVGD